MEQLHVLTAGTLTVDDFATLRFWGSSTLHYRFNSLKIPEALAFYVHTVVRGIVDARKASEDCIFFVNQSINTLGDITKDL